MLVYHIEGQSAADLTNPRNEALREAMRRRLPLVSFRAVSRGWYLRVFPVFVAWEDQATLSFRVAVDPAYGLGAPTSLLGSADDSVDSPLSIKRYVHSVVRSRLHQGRFRIDVLSAYYEVHVNKDLLLETDGPMLKHGIQELNGSRLVLPGSVAKRPDRERLAWRYERFRRAG